MDAEIRLACVDLETGRKFNLLHDSAEGSTRGVRDSIWQATEMRGALALRQARVDAKAKDNSMADQAGTKPPHGACESVAARRHAADEFTFNRWLIAAGAEVDW